MEMLRGVAGKLELHHGVQIMDAAIVDAVKLSHRYISGRQLPDKAISVLDTACARVALGQHDAAAAGACAIASRRWKNCSGCAGNRPPASTTARVSPP